MTTIIRRKKIITDENGNGKGYWSHIQGGDLCFVCDKKFKPAQKKVFVGYHKFTGEKLNRHDYCEAGSSNWTKKFGGRIINDKKFKLISVSNETSDQKPATTIVRRRK